MKNAIQQSKIALEKGEVPVGAIIECNKKIISKSYNNVELLKDPTAHAEMLAISSACSFLKSKYLTNCTIYITLEPCPMCMSAIILSKIKNIVYAASDPENGGISKYSLSTNKISIVKGIMKSEAENILKTFFEKIRK